MSAGLWFDALIRASVMLALGLAAARALRPQSAALRHWVMAIAIALGAAQPALRVAVPEWRVASAAASNALPAAPVEAGPSTVVTFEAAASAMPVVHQRDWASVVRWVWFAGTAFFLASMLIAIVWLWWHSWRAGVAGRAWLIERDLIAASMGITTSVRIKETRHPALLVTWGVIRPVILLPQGASAWPLERIRLVVAHELAHVARRDWLVQMIAEITRACYWPNPLFWLSCARLRIESEQACDDRVLELGNNSASYASHLVDLARSFRAHGRTWLPAPSMARPSTLERRVVAMLNTHVNRHPVSHWRRWAIAVSLAAAALPVAAASISAQSPGGVLRDPSGRVLPAATVRLSAIGVDAIHETQSDATGTFQFPNITDGDYMLSARLPGFQPTRQRVRVNAAMAPLDVVLQVGTLKETISVRGDADSQKPAPPAAALPMPTPPRCGTTGLGGNLKPPMKLKDVRPVYAPELAANNVQGEVLLQAVVGVDGKVRGVEVVSAVDLDLEEAAIKAVSQWEFSPTYLNCEAIEVRMFVTVNFSAGR